MMLVFETANYVLRLLGPEHATERYLGWLRDPEISRTLETDGASQTIETIRAFIKSHDNETRFLFGIFTKDGAFIGTHSFRWYPKDKRATVGVMIGDKAYWGRAVPLETRARLLDWAFGELGCNKIEAGCYSINLPAIYNFKRQRWILEGVQKAHATIEGRPADLLFYAMFQKDWRRERG